MSFSLSASCSLADDISPPRLTVSSGYFYIFWELQKEQPMECDGANCPLNHEAPAPTIQPSSMDAVSCILFNLPFFFVPPSQFSILFPSLLTFYPFLVQGCKKGGRIGETFCWDAQGRFSPLYSSFTPLIECLYNDATYCRTIRIWKLRGGWKIIESVFLNDMIEKKIGEEICTV